MEVIKNTGERPEIAAATPEPLKQLVRKCWATRPEDRPSARGVAEELRKHVDVGQRASDDFFELRMTNALEQSTPDAQEPDQLAPLPPMPMMDNPMQFSAAMRGHERSRSALQAQRLQRGPSRRAQLRRKFGIVVIAADGGSSAGCKRVDSVADPTPTDREPPRQV